MKYLFPLLGLGLAACATEDGADPIDTAQTDTADTGTMVEATVSLAEDVMPAIQTSCGGCHNHTEDANRAAVANGAFFSTTEDLLGLVGSVIVAGDADASQIIPIMAQEQAVGAGPTLMPPPGTGVPAISSASLDAIKTWINEGAQDN